MKRGSPLGFEVRIRFVVMSFLVCGLVVFGISGRRLSHVLPQRFAGLVQGVAHGGYLADGIEHAVVVDEIFVAHDVVSTAAAWRCPAEYWCCRTVAREGIQIPIGRPERRRFRSVLRRAATAILESRGCVGLF